MRDKKIQESTFEVNEKFEQLFKMGVLKQLHMDGAITEKQYKYIIQNQNKTWSQLKTDFI